MRQGSRQVIITGDDFGLGPGINAAIIRAHREGILTCASLMINGSAWQEAVDLAKAWPDLCLGLHLTLIQGRGCCRTTGLDTWWMSRGTSASSR